MSKVDWSGELEAVSDDGRVVPAEFILDDDGDHQPIFAQVGESKFWANRDGEVLGTEWTIRNRAKPEAPTTQQKPPKTLRDEFAMAALMGINEWVLSASEVAELAYRVADAMMAERKKGIEQ